MNNEVLIKKIECNNYEINKLCSYIKKIDNEFPISLSSKVDIIEYSNKIMSCGIVLEAILNNETIGLITFYGNDRKYNKGYISLLCVEEEYRKKGVAENLLKEALNILRVKKIKLVTLFTHKSNTSAINFYKKNGFIECNGVEKRKDDIEFIYYF